MKFLKKVEVLGRNDVLDKMMQHTKKMSRRSKEESGKISKRSKKKSANGLRVNLNPISLSFQGSYS